jgi:glycosyltransferase involved in cell wall biosynthesis
MRRVLIVAYYFPPLGGIGSLRVHGFACHLPDHGWEPTVLAPRDGAYFRDRELRFPEEKVIRTGSIELSRSGKWLLRTGGSDAVAAEVTGVRAVVRAAARSAVYFPDAQVGWYVPALVKAGRTVPKLHFDAIFSSSFPITSHLIARRLHRWLRIPWIADFRDPWSAMLAERGQASARALRLERSLARESTSRIMTSPSWAKLHASTWDCDVEVIPNGHDGNAPKASSIDGLTLAYLGSYYPETQSLEAVLDAVAEMNTDGGERFRLRFIGQPHPALERDLAERGLSDAVEVTGFVGHDEALALLARSSVLLVAGPRDGRGLLRGQVAAKLLEYLATDRPVLYVGDLDCDAATMLRGFPGTELVPVGDSAGVIAALRRFGQQSYPRDAGSLSRASLAGRLAELLTRSCR